MEQRTAAVDFETYYHKTNCSVTVQGTRGYFDHPEFDAYLVSIATSDGGEFVGHPSDFDFSEIADYVWLSHNKGFDETLYHLLRTRKKVTGPTKPEWYCTADLAAYHGFPRDLASLLSYLYGVQLDKGVRDRMSGQRWEKLSPDQQAELMEYAMNDVRYLNRFWAEHSAEWPEHERRISDLTLSMRNRGLPVDAAKLDQSIRTLQEKLYEFEEKIPWFDRNDPKAGKTPLSPKALANECLKLGLPVLSSRAKGDAAAEAWIAAHGETAPFVQAMRDWNSANSLVKKLMTLRDRVIFPEPDDPFYQDLPEELRNGSQAWVPYGMKYCGAHTGRDTGGEGLNVLNMHRGEVFGIDFRSHITAPPGWVFLSADYSQIEPRVLAWLAGDEAFLEAVRGGQDPYVAFGIHTLGHKGEWTKQDRQIWKMMVLSLGYQAGAEKFKGAALTMGGLDIPLDEARRLVKFYRAKNRKVTKFWEMLEAEMRKCSVSTGGSGEFIVTLPSGRNLNYRNVSGRGSVSYVSHEKRGLLVHTYGGALCENATQSLAREAFFDGYLRAESAGIPILLRIYDEFLALVREEEAEEKRALLEEIMCQSPEWAPDLPIAAEAEVARFYKK